jgi:hypothetical protein
VSGVRVCVRACVSVCMYILDIDRLTTLRVSVSARGCVMQAVHSGVYVYASYVYASVLFASTDTLLHPPSCRYEPVSKKLFGVVMLRDLKPGEEAALVKVRC